MGMGLSICHSIIENHNGRIRVSPGVNRGTIFQFELPAESDKHQAGTDVCGQLRLPRWVKTRNAQNEQILSGMPPEADPPEWLAQVFRSDPLNRRGSNAKLLSNLQDAGPILSPEGLANSNFCFLIDPRPAELLSFRFGSRKPRSYSLLDHGPLEFSEHSHHLEHRLSSGRGSVQTLLVKVQIDFERVNFREELYQILQ